MHCLNNSTQSGFCSDACSTSRQRQLHGETISAKITLSSVCDGKGPCLGGWGVGREPPHRPSTAVLVSKVAPGPILGRRWREGSGGLKGRRRVIHHSASRKVSISLGSKLPLVKCSNYIGTKRCCNAFFSFFFILHCIICMFENNTWLCV